MTRLIIFATILGLTAISTVAAPRASAQDGETGITAVDATIQYLQAHDIPNIVAASAFIERPCVKEVSSDAPTCPQSSPAGSLVGSVVFAGCNSGRFFWGPGKHGVGYLFPSVLGDATSHSVFAVLRGSLTPEDAQDYIIALTPGASNSPTEDGSLWQIRANGSIVAVAEQCGGAGIVQSLRYWFATPEYEVEPVYNCTPAPHAEVTVVITVEGVYGDVNPHFWGHGTTRDGAPLEERFIVSVIGTQWEGAVTEFYQVRVGMEVDVFGTRQPDCIVAAAVARVALGDLPAAPTNVSVNFVTREITWTDNADNEIGYIVVYEIAQGPRGETTVPPNTERVVMPGSDAIGGCGLTRITVIAFNNVGNSELGQYQVVADCFLPPTDDSPSTDAIRPPYTGTGAAQSSDGSAVLRKGIVLAAAGAAMLILGTLGRRRNSD